MEYTFSDAITKAKEDRKAGDAFYRRNSKAVAAMVNHYRKSCRYPLLLDEIEGAVNLAFARAIREFRIKEDGDDRDNEKLFFSFFALLSKDEVGKLYRSSTAVSFSEKSYTTLNKVSRSLNKAENLGLKGNETTLSFLEEDTKLPKTTIEEAIKARSMLYVNQLPSYEDEGEEKEVETADEEGFFEDKLLIGLSVSKMLSSLPLRERKAIALAFGLKDGKERKLSEVSRAMGISRYLAEEALSSGLAVLRTLAS